ncbi:MAG: hypothetical protein ABII13_00655 [Patescibacteria group bacterium]|nr:hypothetical protein [Patescibacteria group bacterium]MBU2509025.1 hypothetical protein [Patescibacteria group bacterium]
MNRHLIAIAVIFALFSVTLLGAGCNKSGTASASVNVSELKQPAQAATPKKSPEIPPEAKNIPRPY